MTLYYYRNTHTREEYCSANCALEASLEGINATLPEERLEQILQNTSYLSSDIENLTAINREVADDDAVGEVRKVPAPLISRDQAEYLIHVCDKCFAELPQNIMGSLA